MLTLSIDDREIETEPNKNLLQVCLDHGIYIPNLCWLEEMEEPAASCRLCFVEIKGLFQPMAACAIQVREGMKVRTDTPAVRRLQRTALQLLLSTHDVDCAHCPANKKCVLQDLARFLKIGLKPKGLERYLKEEAVEDRHPFLEYYPNRCVLCGKCVHICGQRNRKPCLTFAQRGFKTVVSLFEGGDPDCEECLACLEVCPVAALRPKED